MLQRLSQLDLIRTSGEELELSDEGLQRATGIIRRHRLAERLLSDVLHFEPRETEEAACEFEHIIDDRITESICRLLGHPRTCPHGAAIPEGACCKAAEREYDESVMPLTEAPLGIEVRVAYTNALTDQRQHQLMHMGIFPGRSIRVHQLRPAVVVQQGATTTAMDQSVAASIYVWRSGVEESISNKKRRFRLFGGS